MRGSVGESDFLNDSIEFFVHAGAEGCEELLSMTVADCSK